MYLRDERNFSLKGLPAANISFVLARLEPAANGGSSTWHAITRRTEAFPGTPTPTPAEAVTGTGPRNQATTEPATAGTWTDQQNGVYTYKFAKSLQDDAEIPFDGSMPHRVGLEIRLSPAIPANNPVYTFNPVTNDPINDSGREIVDNDTCNACHDSLAFHGGARIDLQYCAMCHESYSFDAQTGNSIDLKVMIHKIHRGADAAQRQGRRLLRHLRLPQRVGPTSVASVYPQDKRNCTTCHEESDADTPQASNWRMTVNRGDLHAPATTTSISPRARTTVASRRRTTPARPATARMPGGGPARRTGAPDSGTGRRRAKFRYEVLSVTNTAPGQLPKVTIRVVDPTNGNAPYDIKAARRAVPGRLGVACGSTSLSRRGPTSPTRAAARRRARRRAPRRNRSDRLQGGRRGRPGVPGRASARARRCRSRRLRQVRARPCSKGARPWTSTATACSNAAGEFGRQDVRDHRRVARALSADRRHRQVQRLPPGTDAPRQQPHRQHRALRDLPQPQRDRHQPARGRLELRGGDRHARRPGHRLQVHDPRDPRRARRRLQGVRLTTTPATTSATWCIRARSTTAKVVTWPTRTTRRDSSTALATTIDAGPDRSTPAGDVAISPAAAACSACHSTRRRSTHMQQNGGSFNAVKDAATAGRQAPIETCAELPRPRQGGRRQDRAWRRPVRSSIDAQHRERTQTHEVIASVAARPGGAAGAARRSGPWRWPRCLPTRPTRARRTARRGGHVPRLPRRSRRDGVFHTSTLNHRTPAARSARASCSAKRATGRAAITPSA